MLDTNEAITDNKYLLRFMASHNLVSLIQPLPVAHATYNRGSKCIDYILGSQRLQQCTFSAGYLPFYEGGWPTSDHRAAFVDMDHVALFGATTNGITPSIPRMLTSKCKRSVKKFIQLIAECHKLPTLLA
jgi:hypothetical protein